MPVTCLYTGSLAAEVKKSGHEWLGTFYELVQAGLARVSRLPGMNDGDLADFSRLDELLVSSGVGVFDERLFVLVVGKHTVIFVRALVTGGAAGCVDAGIV